MLAIKKEYLVCLSYFLPVFCPEIGSHLAEGLIHSYSARGDSSHNDKPYSLFEQTKELSGKTAYGWRGYNGLVDFGYKKHFRVHHGKNEFARGNSHINSIELF